MVVMRAFRGAVGPVLLVVLALALLLSRVAAAQTTGSADASVPEASVTDASAAEVASPAMAPAASPVIVAPPPPTPPSIPAPAPSAPSASPATASSPAASASGSAAPAVAPAIVRVHEREVFTVRAPRAGRTPIERARAASEALGTLVGESELPPARVEEQGATATVFVGKTPVVSLGPEDAAAAGDIALNVHAASVATRVQEALRLEQKRSAIATTVFSVSLVVFSGLIAFLLLRRVNLFEDKARTWMEAHPARLPAVRLGQIEVVSPPAVRGAINIALHVGQRFAQLAIVYAWLIVALSLFESTRGYTTKLTGFVVTPVSTLMSRTGSALPVLVVGVIAALALALVVRFVGLFFGSVGRGETKLGWLPSDLAGPTSVLVRAGIVIVALIAAAPLLTGSDEGALSRAGIAALVTIALACTPVLACGAVGVPVVFGRRLRRGDFVEAGGRSGRVRGVTLLELRLEDACGCEVRVPHLLGLWYPTRIVGRAPMISIAITIDPRSPLAKVRAALLTGCGKMSTRAKIELVSLDADGARYRVSCPDDPAADLAAAIADALAADGIALGRASSEKIA